MYRELIDLLRCDGGRGGRSKAEKLPVCVYLSILRFLAEEGPGDVDADDMALTEVPTRKLRVLMNFLAPSQIKSLQSEKMWSMLNKDRAGTKACLDQYNLHAMGEGNSPLCPLTTFSYHGDPSGIKFKHSKVWVQQQSFYERSGARAWTKAVVPSQISTNCFVRDYYFDILASYIADDIKRAATRSPLKHFKVVVIEFAAGHGALTLLMARAHFAHQSDLYNRICRQLRDCDQNDSPGQVVPPQALTISFVATDFHDGVFRDLLELEYVQELCREGLLAFSVAKAQTQAESGGENKVEEPLRDLDGRAILGEGEPLDCCVFLANYAFDSFPSSLFVKSEAGHFYGLGVVQRRDPAIVEQRRAARKEKKRRRRERRARWEGQRGGGATETRKRKRGGRAKDSASTRARDGCGGGVHVDASPNEKWVAMRLDDDGSGEENVEEAMARRALNRLDGPGIVAMSSAGLQLLSTVLRKVDMSCKGGVASVGLIVGDCVMEGDDKQYGAKRLGDALDRALRGGLSGCTKRDPDRQKKGTSPGEGVTLADVDACFEIPHISPDPRVMALPVSLAALETVFESALHNWKGSQEFCKYEMKCGASVGSGFTVVSFKTAPSSGGSTLRSSLSTPLPLPGFGPGEYQALRQFLLCGDHCSPGRGLRDSLSPRAWLRFFTLGGADLDVILRQGWTLYRLLVQKWRQSDGEEQSGNREEVRKCVTALHSLLDSGLERHAYTSEVSRRAVESKVDNFKQVLERLFSI